MKTKTHDNLKQYESARAKLEAEKADLEERLSTIVAALGSTNGTAPPVQSRRPIGSGQPSLKSLVLEVTGKRPLSKQDIMRAVLAKGYQFTTAKPFSSLNALLYDRKSGVINRNGLFGPKL